MSERKLGLILGTEPSRRFTVNLDDYVDESVVIPDTLPRPTTAEGYAYGMLANDQYGDCVSAAAFHIQETFRLKEGIQPHPWTAETALAWYFAINGVPPGPPGSSSDQGSNPQTAMQYWRTNGLPAHLIAGYGVLNGDSPNIRRAIYEFGAVMFAVALPVEAQSQGVHWRWTGGTPGSWGGHAVAGDSYTPDLLGFISWGEEGDMDNPWAQNCMEQCLVPLSHDAIGKGGVGPGGFNFTKMAADLPTLT